jgi:small-conductance mechanosensitive channel
MEDHLSRLIQFLQSNFDIIQTLIIVLIAIIIFSIIIRGAKKYLLKKIKTKRQVSNVTTFLDLIKFLFFFFLIIIAVVSYYGKWGELGFIAGLLTVAIGWALQKPISGVVAWLILIIRRPIHVGDRIIIRKIIGDITEITLTHIFLNEVGGTIEGEESSGRTVMIPTSIIFEEEIINYTEIDDFILDEVKTAITYESDLEEAEKIVINSVEQILKPIWKKFPKSFSIKPHNRIRFRDSGIELTVRYYTIANKRNKISTNIRRKIHNRIKNNANVEFAYPHTEVVFREKLHKDKKM